MAKSATTEKYIEGIGRRKTSVARVRITPSSKTSFIINDKNIDQYFKTDSQKKTIMEALDIFEEKKHFDVSAHIYGGGLSSQAESLRLGLSRALVKLEEESRKTLKKAGYLKRDPRSKERKKFGLKKARKAAQWSKR
ncbi:30S ribosomal protein S9 [Candidatus Nomurabacteria bacterium]|nr:30S ribosomal protein S9 [Candidatus Nomurabacteria bacterium]